MVKMLMRDEILMENMTWTEIKEAIEKGKDAVMVVVGSIEQHGPHLPTATDTLCGCAIAERVARKMGRVLIAPAIRPGYSEHHMHFPGTISLRPEVLIEVIKDYCRCLARQGFKRIILLPTHGGNFPLVEIAAAQIFQELKATFPVKMAIYTDLPGFLEKQFSIAKENGISNEQCGTHAGECETSEILAIDRNLVKLENAEKGFTGKYTNAVDSKLALEGIETVTENGVLGNPKGATEHMGNVYLEKMADFLAKTFKERLA
jgi:creatinine amidohydrolase